MINSVQYIPIVLCGDSNCTIFHYKTIDKNLMKIAATANAQKEKKSLYIAELQKISIKKTDQTDINGSMAIMWC